MDNVSALLEEVAGMMIMTTYGQSDVVERDLDSGEKTWLDSSTR